MSSIPINPADGSFVDNQGSVYRMGFDADPPLWTFYVTDGKLPIARAYCWIMNEHELRLNDIRVADALPKPALLVTQMIRQYLGISPRILNFQRRGIGTALLKSIIETAKINGYRRIYGEVKNHDVSRFDGLPDWYAKQGFEVTHVGSRILISCHLPCRL